jgi:hypothetical protein
MNDITKAAIDRIAAQLTNLGCVFRIDRDGGVLHNTLPTPDLERKRAPRRDFEAMGLYEKLRSIKPGEVVRVDAPEGIPVTDVQSVLAARMVGMYGKGTYMTQRVAGANAVDVLRME